VRRRCARSSRPTRLFSSCTTGPRPHAERTKPHTSG
jgi:hypothetical protein